eukprot:Gb_02785 [translate_table: standard]
MTRRKEVWGRGIKVSNLRTKDLQMVATLLCCRLVEEQCCNDLLMWLMLYLEGLIQGKKEEIVEGNLATSPLVNEPSDVEEEMFVRGDPEAKVKAFLKASIVAEGDSLEQMQDDVLDKIQELATETILGEEDTPVPSIVRSYDLIVKATFGGDEDIGKLYRKQIDCVKCPSRSSGLGWNIVNGWILGYLDFAYGALCMLERFSLGWKEGYHRKRSHQIPASEYPNGSIHIHIGHYVAGHSEFQLIHELCLYVLSASQRPELIRATLATLHAFLSWIPLGYIFESPLLDTLLNLFPVAAYRNLALQCLTEVASLNFGDFYDAQFVKLYTYFMIQLQNILPPGANIPDAYANDTSEDQSHIRILEMTPENQAALLMGLGYLIDISYVDDTEVFKVCLDYWNSLVLELFEAHNVSDNPAASVNMMGLPVPLVSGMVDGLSSQLPQRRHLYSGPMSKLRMLMICRMAKPEEVLIVEDENGNIVRETLKDNDVLVQVTKFGPVHSVVSHKKITRRENSSVCESHCSCSFEIPYCLQCMEHWKQKGKVLAAVNHEKEHKSHGNAGKVTEKCVPWYYPRHLVSPKSKSVSHTTSKIIQDSQRSSPSFIAICWIMGNLPRLGYSHGGLEARPKAKRAFWWRRCVPSPSYQVYSSYHNL